jgi:polyhydroxybutyrate depolymerase
MLAKMQDIVSIDLKRVFATGMSNGGIMAYRLACEAADIFAAVGSVAGTQNFSPCQPSEPVAVIHFHGTDDQHVPYEGGIGTQAFAGTYFASVPDTVNFWVAFNGCNPKSNSDLTGDVREDVWEGCEANASVELYTIFSGGHVWPGSERSGSSGTNESLSATDLIWEFFATHPKH